MSFLSLLQRVAATLATAVWIVLTASAGHSYATEIDGPGPGGDTVGSFADLPSPDLIAQSDADDHLDADDDSEDSDDDFDSDSDSDEDSDSDSDSDEDSDEDSDDSDNDDSDDDDENA